MLDGNKAEFNKPVTAPEMDAKVLKINGDTVDATAEELDILDGQAASAVIVVGDEDANVINVAIQLKDAAGVDMAVPVCLPWYLAEDAAGLVLAASSPDAIAIGTDGTLIQNGESSVLSGLVISEADGDIDIDVTKSGADTYYFVLVLPTGKLAISAAITTDSDT